MLLTRKSGCKGTHFLPNLQIFLQRITQFTWIFCNFAPDEGYFDSYTYV